MERPNLQVVGGSTVSPPREDGQEPIVEKIARNATFTTINRIIVMAVSTVGLPIVGFLLTQLITAANNISAKVDVTSVQLQLLQQKVEFGFDTTKTDIVGIKGQLNDHETRIRNIERGPR